MAYDDNTAAHWADEIRAAEAHMAKHHIPIARMIQQFGTKWFRDDLTAEPTPENHVFAWVAWMLPQLAYAAPAPNVDANWEILHKPIAQYQQAAGRRWCQRANLRETFALWVRDALFAYGVIKRGLEFADGKMQPYLQHVPMDRWGCDPAKVDSLSDAKFQYHKYRMCLDEIAEMRGVDPAAAAKITSNYDTQGETGGTGVRGGMTAERKEVWVYDVWMRKSRQIATLVGSGPDDPSTVWLRPPRPFWGSKDGPFCVLGFKSVPGSPVPCSDLQPVMQQIEAANAQLRAEAMEAAGFKTIVGIDDSAPEAGKAIEQAEHSSIVMIPGLARGVVQMIEVGKVHAGRTEHTERMLERVKRQLAMGDAQQGISNGDTATANQIADAASNIRVKGMQALVNSAAAAAMAGGPLWYQFHDNGVEERVTIDVPKLMAPPMMGGMGQPGMPGQQPGMMPQPGGGGAPGAMPGMPPIQQTERAEGYVVGGIEGGWYRGEFLPPQEDVAWPDDFSVTVDPDSTRHTSDQESLDRAMLLMDVQERAYVALSSMPGAQVAYVVDRIGESVNIPNLFRQLFSPQLVAMAQAQQPMPPMMIPAGAGEGLVASVGQMAGTGRPVGFAPQGPAQGGGFGAGGRAGPGQGQPSTTRAAGGGGGSGRAGGMSRPGQRPSGSGRASGRQAAGA